MNTTFRHDAGTLQKPIEQPDGSLVVEGIAARTHSKGDPLVYASGEEYRAFDQLAVIAQHIAGKPVTLGHPDGGVMVPLGEQIVGTVESAWVEGQAVHVRLKITDAAAIAALRSGVSELSMGYGSSADASGYQRIGTVYHLAIVPRGRCTGPGGACVCRVDHAEQNREDRQQWDREIAAYRNARFRRGFAAPEPMVEFDD